MKSILKEGNYLSNIVRLLNGGAGIQTQISLFRSPCILFDMMNLGRI